MTRRTFIKTALATLALATLPRVLQSPPVPKFVGPVHFTGWSDLPDDLTAAYLTPGDTRYDLNTRCTQVYTDYGWVGLAQGDFTVEAIFIDGERIS